MKILLISIAVRFLIDQFILVVKYVSVCMYILVMLLKLGLRSNVVILV